jgi:hypothetical protein
MEYRMRDRQTVRNEGQAKWGTERGQTERGTGQILDATARPTQRLRSFRFRPR